MCGGKMIRKHSRKGILLSAVLLLVLVLSMTGGAGAQADTSPYIVVMEGKPVIAYEGDISGFPATKPGKP